VRPAVPRAPRRAAARPPAWALAATASAAMLCSGCLTAGMWSRVASGSPASHVAGMGPGPGGDILVSARQCPDRPDGTYALSVPGDWAARPLSPSRWGSEVQALAVPLEFINVDGQAKAHGGLETLSLRALAAGRPPRPGAEYGLVQYRTADDRLAAEFFGYSHAHGQWVHLGGAILDRHRPRAGAVAGAVMATPLTVSVDLSLFVLSRGNYFPGPGFEPRPESVVRGSLMATLEHEDASRRAAAATALRPMGMEAKPAAPALRRMLQDPDPRTRLEAAHTLVLICPRDVAQDGRPIVDLLASGEARVRRLAASKAGILPAGLGVPALTEALRDPDAEVRAQAARVLTLVGPASDNVVNGLIEASCDASPQVRKAAAAALREITGGRGRGRPPRGAAGQSARAEIAAD